MKSSKCLSLSAWIGRGTAVAVGLAGAPVLAQDTSDLMKPVQAQIESQNQLQQSSAPGTGSGGGRTYLPGVTSPAQQIQQAQQGQPGQGQGQGQPPRGPRPAGAPGDTQTEPPEGQGRGTAVLEDEEGGSYIASESGNTPVVHRISKGETLSSIAQRYFGTPASWPRLWALNPAITNPHWIYPGDEVRLVSPSELAALTPPTQVIQPTPGGPQLIIPTRSQRRGLLLLHNGFVEAEALKEAGTVSGSPLERNLLSELDDVYIDFKGRGKKATTITPGQRYTVYRVLSTVKHPVTDREIGALVEILGEIEMGEARSKRLYKGKVVDSLGPIERGDRVGPLRRTVEVVEPRKAKVDLDGHVVATLRPMVIFGADTLVFIDHGSDDGVVAGNRVQVVRRGDASKVPPATQAVERQPLDDPRYPREVVAEMLIVDVHRQTSGAVILMSTREVHLGDRTEIRRGR